MRARSALLVAGVLTLTSVAGAWAQTARDQGRDAGKMVKERYGNGAAVESLIFQPLGSDKKMETVDRQPFDAKLQCPAQQEFMRVSFAPTSANDLQVVAVELDRDLNGSREYSTAFTGPYAAVCTNGMVVCDAGSTNNCRGRKWRVSSGALVVDDVASDQLGGCYCFNDSCGAGLLGSNSAKVLDDLGSGIAVAMQDEYPRLSIGNARTVDATTRVFYGQSSGCSADSAPEQYYKNPEQIRPAGQAAASDPTSLYSRLSNSDIAHEKELTEQQCSIRRNIELKTRPFDVNEILTLNSGTHTSATSCGPRCYDVTVGRTGNNYLKANCGNYVDTASWTLHKPELIESAVLTYLSYDDYFSVVFDDRFIVWSDPAGTDGLTRYCGENGARGSRYPNVDVTAYLRAKPPESSWTWRNSTWWNDKGEGWAVLRIVLAENCEFDQEYVDNACAALDANMACSWRDETVDTAATRQNYYSTGLSQLPSSRTFSRGSCSLSFTRDYWEKQRVYTCEGAQRQFDGKAAADRYSVVSSSFDSTTGQFQDMRTDGSGAKTYYSMSTPLPPPEATGCQRMCKTRKPRAGQSMGESGSTGKLNPSAPAWDYTYRECDASDVCPLEAGEEVAAACDCQSNFAAAVSMMQSIRMTQQDMQCTAP